ncbi:hypothetical protein K504DRAFT_482550 [Pleomassaria siparia CBS 279.74]|uniref:Ketopantoate reductase N-terminal domain-containing protein n=1 Tax=Pleomassaria siparia CBS 279.74 TaxID=1314801 RepID=A0A6G1K553_9PLEO|nr:hypothetical protein K504DRAFT_482550 [Pleomassaria siparia CBS 279.74]
MAESTQPKVLIVGAGSMGLISGYHLQLAGAETTFLIRPHRAEPLKKPVTFYSYNDHTLKEYTDYKYIIDPAEIKNVKYDYILITLDAAALRNEVGQALAKSIGDTIRGTNTKVVLGSIFIGLLPWFLEVSGLPAEQVTNGFLYIHVYGTAAVTLPVHAPTNPELLKKADQAYVDHLGPGFGLDDSSPSVAQGFSELWNKSGVSTADIKTAVALATTANLVFAIFAAFYLTGWPRFADMGLPQYSEIWSLGVKAVKEILTLSIHGDMGKAVASMTTEEALLGQMIGYEQAMLPLDLSAFSKYHHGGKVNVQDRAHLKACVKIGEQEGAKVEALKELIKRVEEKI